MATYSDWEQRQLDQMEIKMEPRFPTIGDAVDRCARGTMTFRELCSFVAAMGFKTTRMYEAVRARKAELEAARTKALASLSPVTE